MKIKNKKLTKEQRDVISKYAAELENVVSEFAKDGILLKCETFRDVDDYLYNFEYNIARIKGVVNL